MKILVLDDDPDRHHTFKQILSGHQVTHVTSVDKCVAALKDHRFDLVFLDHDLADFSNENYVVGMYGYQELTGTDVARFMANDLPIAQRPHEVIVHSWNPDGAKRMVSTLQDAGFNVRFLRFDPKVLRAEFVS